MELNAVSFEKRVKRIRDGLPSDPDFAIPALKKLVAMPVCMYFGSDRRRAQMAIEPLVDQGIEMNSPLGEVTGAIDRAWTRMPDEQPNIYRSILSLARVMATLSHTKGESARGYKVSTSRKPPSSAGFSTAMKFPLEERMKAAASGRFSTVEIVAGLRHGAFMEAVGRLTDRRQVLLRKRLVERNWDINSYVTVARLAECIVERMDDPKAIMLIDAYIVKSLAWVYEVED